MSVVLIKFWFSNFSERSFCYSNLKLSILYLEFREKRIEKAREKIAQKECSVNFRSILRNIVNVSRRFLCAYRRRIRTQKNRPTNCLTNRGRRIRFWMFRTIRLKGDFRHMNKQFGDRQLKNIRNF